ncbi:MAG: hypothetical protein PHU14_02570 [Methylovulum sp.]|nr:hypothetical protein [Methylovulum sp.]
MNPLIKSIKYHPLTVALFKAYYQFRCRKLKKIIFVATTGRSGTMTLTNIFNAIPGACHAEHEPYPIMFDDVLKAKAAGDEAYVRNEYWRKKAINLRRAAAGYDFYCEANHLFIKTYIEYAVEDFGDKVAVIHLVRDPVKVANSIYALQDYPGTQAGNQWWLDYTAGGNHIRIADWLDNDPEFKHPFYKALWYWYEVEARIAHWRRALPHILFVDFYTEDFNDPQKTFALLKDLGIAFDEAALTTEINTQANTREHQKTFNPLPIDQAIAMNGQFKQLLTGLGY